MPEISGYGPADPQSLRLLNSGRAKILDANSAQEVKKPAQTRQPGSVEVILGASKAHASGLTYENLKPKS